MWLRRAIGTGLLALLGAAPLIAREVAVRADVWAKDGSPVPGLGPADFRVQVAGRETALLAVQEAPPISLLVVLEVSRERFEYQAALRRGIDRLTARLRPDDEIGVVVFGSAVLTLFPLSSDHLETRRKVLTHHLQAVGPGQFRLDDALLAAVEALADRDGRGALLVFTRGWDEGSETPREPILDLAQHGTVRLDFVHTRRPRAWSGGYWRMLIDSLRGMATPTGGAIAAVESPEDIVPLFEARARRVLSGYRLVLDASDFPDPKGSIVSLRVKVTGKGRAVSAPRRLSVRRRPLHPAQQTAAGVDRHGQQDDEGAARR